MLQAPTAGSGRAGPPSNFKSGAFWGKKKLHLSILTFDLADTFVVKYRLIATTVTVYDCEESFIKWRPACNRRTAI